MKQIFTAAITFSLIMVIGCCAFAYETDFDDLGRFDRNLPAWKFGRGVTNMMSGPYELLTHMTNNAIKGAYHGSYDGGFKGNISGALNGFIAGTGTGLLYGLRRMTVGALEMLTFWKPEYGPTMDPTYGTRNLAWGRQDYFDPDQPYWYNSIPMR